MRKRRERKGIPGSVVTTLISLQFMQFIIIIQLTKIVVIKLWIGTFSMGTYLHSEHGNQWEGGMYSSYGGSQF
jgi:hypothetical protein